MILIIYISLLFGVILSYRNVAHYTSIPDTYSVNSADNIFMVYQQHRCYPKPLGLIVSLYSNCNSQMPERQRQTPTYVDNQLHNYL